MRSGEIVYTNSIEARSVPGPKPPLRATFKTDDKNKSFVFLCLGVSDKPVGQQEFDAIMESWGYVKKKTKK